MTETLHIAQLSDTHFLEPGAEPEGGHSYDTALAFERVLDHLDGHGHLDHVVVTGDVADHGRPAQYDLAVEALGRLPVEVHLCPGNHDLDEPLRSSGLSIPDVVERGSWAFVFADSNAGAMTVDDDGRRVDPDDGSRLHSDGSWSDDEADRLRALVAATDAEHVFVWLHHPPGIETPLQRNPPYTEAWEGLLTELTTVRGLGGGHTHVPAELDVAGRPVFVAPSFKNNFDLEVGTWLPPGYRTYEFHPDGSITSEVHLLDDERWPRRPMGRAIRALFAGELTHADLRAIAERKARERTPGR